MQQLMSNYGGVIIFLHILSAIIWIGGMIAMRIAVHPAMQTINEPHIKLGKTLEIIGRLFALVLPFVVILLITAVVMTIGLGFAGTPLSITAHTKEVIWLIMTINFTYMFTKRTQAQRLFDDGDMAGAKAKVANFANLLLPINIALGLLALYLGVVLRGY